MSARIRTSEQHRTDRKGGVEGMRKRVLALGLSRTQVGVPGSVRETESGIPIATIAFVHEFGSPERGIPERSFLRAGIIKNRKNYIALAAKGAGRVADGSKTPGQVLGLIGSQAAGDVQNYIREGEFKALKPATIARKGSSKPLIDTGQLRQSITYKVISND